MKETKIGVYIITCLSNNKVYIGSSQNIEKRWKTHKAKLFNKTHRNKHLQNAYQKYGAENITYSILELVSKENLIIREQYWMDEYNSYNREKGSNQTLAR